MAAYEAPPNNSFLSGEIITEDVDSEGENDAVYEFSDSEGDNDFYGFVSDDCDIYTSSSSESVYSSSDSLSEPVPLFLPATSSVTSDITSTIDFEMQDASPQPLPPLSPPSPPAKKKRNKRKRKRKSKRDIRFPPRYDVKNWIEDMSDLDTLPPFIEEPGFDFDLPDGHLAPGTPDVSELFFYKLFMSDELLENIVEQTNLYHDQVIAANPGKFSKHSRYNKWPEGGVPIDRMKTFIALTFFMGMLSKKDIQSYWSTDSMMHIPFVGKTMPRDEFLRILMFFHLCDNTTYPPRSSQEYDPRKKLGMVFTWLTSRFTSLYTPRQNLSIDEGGIPFKGRVHFLCFNKSKINKYHIKTFKVCDSSNNYCLVFDLYCGKEFNVEPLTEYGKVHDLILRLIQPYLGKSYVIHMDNWYTSPILVYNLKLVQTGVAGTVKGNRIGLPEGFANLKVSEPGDRRIFSMPGHMQLIKIYDRKPVNLISSVYTCQPVPIGKKHWKTGEEIMKPEVMHSYNKYMGGVDANDQLLQYSAFNRQTLKWWKKTAMRLMNIAMVNAFTLYKEYMIVKYPSKRHPRHYDFRLAVIRQILGECVPVDIRHVSCVNPDFQRLNGRHFPQKVAIPPGKKKVQRQCVVCTPAERKMAKLQGIENKNPGHSGMYQCKSCQVALCIDPCFELYHTKKDFISKYISLKRDETN